MTLDWSLVVLLLGTLTAAVIVVRPFVMERTVDKARETALADINKRLKDIEAHLMSNVRKMPGVLR